MARQSGQKVKLLAVRQLLLERGDEERPISTEEFLTSLERQGISAERKSIYRDMETLREWGMDVQFRKGKNGGWFLGQRDFELPELKLLVDAVQSSRFISRKKSDALIRKLEGLTSVGQARQLQRQVYVAGRVKAMNESVYYTIDKLHTALNARRAVTFKYFEYNMRKEKVFRRDGKRYAVSPYGLIWDNENYYLAGFDHARREMRHYRVDKMAELAVTCLPLQGDEACRNFDIASYSQKHFGMFSGREGQVRLRCRSHLVGVVLDRFGQEAILIPDGEDRFTVTVSAVVSPQFLGWIFGLGDGVEVCSPAWAVDELNAQLQAVQRLYRKEESL